MQRSVGTSSRFIVLPRVIVTEAVATVRLGLWPLGWLRPLPAPPRPETGRPIVLVHGFLGHPEMWRTLTRRLYENHLGPVHAVGYPSTRFAIDEIARRIHRAVVPLAAQGPIDVVGHSLGAVATRAWLKRFGGASYVRRFISLGGPHAGTDFYRFAPSVLWPVLNPEGYWPKLLAQDPEPVETVVIRSRYDQHVVPPVRAALPGIEEIVLSGGGHNGLLWSRESCDAVIEVLKRD
ncbi:MAG: alpha/beta fold hydrolase [Myxococcota bacterium]